MWSSSRDCKTKSCSWILIVADGNVHWTYDELIEEHYGPATTTNGPDGQFRQQWYSAPLEYFSVAQSPSWHAATAKSAVHAEQQLAVFDDSAASSTSTIIDTTSTAAAASSTDVSAFPALQQSFYDLRFWWFSATTTNAAAPATTAATAFCPVPVE